MRFPCTTAGFTADLLRELLRLAHAAIRLGAMFLLDSELRPAIEAFAVKFADIMRRRRVLYGEDPFAGISISREDAILRLNQILLNLTLRLREAYISRGLREEQLVATIADMAGPLRSCAATLLELEGKPAESPKEALHQVAASLPDGQARAEELSRISREERTLKMLLEECVTRKLRRDFQGHELERLIRRSTFYAMP